MDVGTGIAMGCGVLGAVAVIFKIFDNKNKGKVPDVCMAHSGMLTSINNIEKCMAEIKADVKSLLKAS